MASIIEGDGLMTGRSCIVAMVMGHVSLVSSILTMYYYLALEILPDMFPAPIWSVYGDLIMPIIIIAFYFFQFVAWVGLIAIFEGIDVIRNFKHTDEVLGLGISGLVVGALGTLIIVSFTAVFMLRFIFIA